MLPLAALRSQDEFHRIVAAGDPVQRATPVRASVHRARGMVMVHDGATGVRTAEQGAVEMILLGCAHGDDDALGGGITEFARQVERATESDLGARSGSSSTVTCWAGGGVLTAAARRLAARRHVPAFRRASRAIAGPPRVAATGPEDFRRRLGYGVHSCRCRRGLGRQVAAPGEEDIGSRPEDYGRSTVGSVIKKRRKRMAKKKHRKLLKKTRIQRRRAGK